MLLICDTCACVYLEFSFALIQPPLPLPEVQK